MRDRYLPFWVYFLIKDNVVVYVGLTGDLSERLNIAYTNGGIIYENK